MPEHLHDVVKTSAPLRRMWCRCGWERVGGKRWAPPSTAYGHELEKAWGMRPVGAE